MFSVSRSVQMVLVIVVAWLPVAAHGDHVKADDLMALRRLSVIQDLAGKIAGSSTSPSSVPVQADAVGKSGVPSPGGAKGAELFYRTGQRATRSGGEMGEEWVYPGGQRATWQYGEQGAEWYWPNGQRATSRAGVVGAEWFYPNGQRVSRQVGAPDAEWSYSNGVRMTWSGPRIPEGDLLDAPRFMLFLLWIDGGTVPPF